MMFILRLLVLSSLSVSSALSVRGFAQGFAHGVTGGGWITPVVPKDNAELIAYLADKVPRVIVLSKVFDFTGSEGTVRATGCAPWGTSSKCQLSIDHVDWCKKNHPKAARVTVEYDKAGILGLSVASDKTILGRGKDSGIKGKGLRIVQGAQNVIIQNIAITDINSKYNWGGDAITLDGTDLIWIDRVTIARIGRQHIVSGFQASNRVTISNSFFDGRTKHSATCDGYHHWGLYFTGANDYIALKGNFIYHMSGRSPKTGGSSIVHAVNNYWYDNPNYAIEAGKSGDLLLEGNLFRGIKKIVHEPARAQIFASPNIEANQVCKKYLGRPCMINGFRDSSALSQAQTGFLANLQGKNVVAPMRYKSVPCSVRMNAGQIWPWYLLRSGRTAGMLPDGTSLPRDGFDQCS